MLPDELFFFNLLGFCLCQSLLDLSVGALTAFLNGVCHGGCDQANCADSVIVCGDNVIDLIGVAVGIDDCNDGDVQLASLCDCIVLLAGVNDEHCAGELLHFLDAAEVLLELLHLAHVLHDFLLGKHIEGAVLLHLLELSKAIDTGAHGLEVGEHTAQPPGVDKVHPAAFGLFTDGFGRLLLGSDEQYLAGRLMGADAGIGGTYGAMPELYLKLDELIGREEIKKAQKLQIMVTDFIYRLCSFPSMYGACKTIIRMDGVDIGEPRLPFLPVDEKDPAIIQLYKDIRGAVEETRNW